MLPAKAEASSPSLFFDAKLGADYRQGTYGEDIEKRGLSPFGQASFAFDAGVVGFLGSISAHTDGKYAPFLADSPTGTLGNISVLMDEGGAYSNLGPVTLKAGRFKNYDVIDSPYALFMNSQGLSAPTASLAYKDESFFFESRWIGLNLDSNQTTQAWPSGFPDRAMVMRVAGMEKDGLRAGFQEATVFCHRYFDFEYFFNPIPQMFTQLVRGLGGTPWSTDNDDNYIVGFFIEKKKEGEYKLLAQAFIDDLGMMGLFGWTNNPWQVALTLGGELERPSGTWALNIAGATKYAFAPSTSDMPYSYTYYPDTRFDYDWQTDGFQPKNLSIEDNMIGYKYGENNLALELSWKKHSSSLDLGAAFEFRLAGANSPTNPWHDITYDPQTGFEWLNDALLEKRVLLSLWGEQRRGAWSLMARATGGIACDALELRAPEVSASASAVEQNSYIYAPVAGNTKFLIHVSLGASYRYQVKTSKHD